MRFRNWSVKFYWPRPFDLRFMRYTLCGDCITTWLFWIGPARVIVQRVRPA